MPAKRDWRTDLEKHAITDAYHKTGQGLKRMTRGATRLKAVGKGVAPIDKLGDIGGGIKFEAVLPKNLLGAVDGTVHLQDPDVAALLQRLDTVQPEDVAMAERVVAMKRSGGQFANAPYTELMAHDWFTQKGIQFAYQVPLDGGRTSKLGQVVDFVTFGGGHATAIPVDGNYWHSRPDVAASDVLDHASTIGQYVNGQRITRNVPVWESRLYKDRNQVLSLAIVGVELPK
ncbi:MAG: hypothetical protein H0U76_29285 [Ktedonobacteraceae bacterium]|nr:hypothetical protein [Ktedonobacteraceae bacterium]